MLPEVVWNMPRYGSYNLHGSLLPRYRGAAPINWAVINGESVTGVTSFKLKHEIDTGSICLQKEIPIYPSDNAGDLHDRMKYIAAEVVLETVIKIKDNDILLTEQNDSELSHAPKLNKENTQINFNLSVREVNNFVRGLSPFPTAWLTFNNNHLKIYKAEVNLASSDYHPGDIVSDNKNYINIYCTDGYISLIELQYTGKRKMGVKEFLNGFDMAACATKIV